jgi:hypothetical protein
MGGGNSHQRAKARAAEKARIRKEVSEGNTQPKVTPQRLDVVEAKSNTQRGLNLGDSIGLAALIFAMVAVILTPPLWLKAILLVLSGVGCFVFFNKSHWTNYWSSKRRYVGAVVVVVFLVGIGVPQLREQWKAGHAAPVQIPHSTQTVLVRYTQEMLPLSIPSKDTYYILAINPKIFEGIYERRNESSIAEWWPRKPITKKEHPLGMVYACRFTNYGDKALLAVAVEFDLSFYSVVEAHGEFRKNPDGTSSLSATLPKDQIIGTPDPGIRRMVYAEQFNGKVTAISPGNMTSRHNHRAVIPVIPPGGGSATLYLVNESKLFAHLSFPTAGDSIVIGDPKKQPMVLIRPDVNIRDRIPDLILPPSTYPWTGVPDSF